MQATPQLLIPGLLCDETVWEPLIGRLPGPVQVADLSTRSSITEMAEYCLDMFDGPMVVAGHSMGARVAMEIARIAPERVKRLALLDTGIHPLGDNELEKRREIIQFAHDNGMQALADNWLPGMVFEPNQQDVQMMDKLNRMVLAKDPDLHERQITALIGRPNAALYLSQIQCPVLLMVGRQDAWAPVSQHQDMLNLLPDARLEIIENAGHFAPLEQPDTVTRLLSEFLAD